MSIIIALITTVVCVFIAYPFAYFLTTQKSKLYKALVISLVTTPI